MTSRWSARRQAFRRHMAGDSCLYPASVHDPVSARIAAGLGFEIGMLAGSVASMAVLGAPDLIVLTLTEFAEQAHRISRAAELPLMVDADHGYGNALNVMRTVEELETAGVAGLSIEDTALPVGFGAADRLQLTSLEEGVGKMKAALAGRRDRDLMIAGRTSAPMVAPIEETIRRVEAYQAAGVDAIFVVGLKSREQVERVAEKIRLPMILGGLPAELIDKDQLGPMGVRICLQGHQPFEAAAAAIHATMKALREGTKPADLAGLPPRALLRQVTQADDYERWMRGFLG